MFCICRLVCVFIICTPVCVFCPFWGNMPAAIPALTLSIAIVFAFLEYVLGARGGAFG
jgi:hypothetical protein